MGAVMNDRVARTLELFEREEATLDEMAQRMGGALVGNDGEVVYQGLPEICREWDVAYGKVLTWLMADERRYGIYQRCLEVQAHHLVGEVVGIADAPPVAVLDDKGKPIRDDDGEVVTVRNNVARDKLRVETRLRVAKHHASKLYGEKVEHSHVVVPVFQVNIWANDGGGGVLSGTPVVEGESRRLEGEGL
jgi:hypothetical protein